MAVVRHFALNLVRQVVDKRSIKRRRKRAAWDPQYLLDTLGPLQSRIPRRRLIVFNDPAHRGEARHLIQAEYSVNPSRRSYSALTDRGAICRTDPG
jgi:hypothetical protein